MIFSQFSASWYALPLTSVVQQVAEVWLFCVSRHIARLNNDSVDFLLKWSWQALPSVRGVTVQHESALDIYLFTHTRVIQRFASETRDQQVLPPGVSAMQWPFLFILALRSKSLHFDLTKEWDSIFVCAAVGTCVICVCGPNGLWLQP